MFLYETIDYLSTKFYSEENQMLYKSSGDDNDGDNDDRKNSLEIGIFFFLFFLSPKNRSLI